MWVRERLGAERVSERRACQVLGQVRSTQRRERQIPDDEARLVARMVELARVVAQFRSGHGPIPVLFECYRIRTDSGMPRLDIRFSTSHLMMASTR